MHQHFIYLSNTFLFYGNLISISILTVCIVLIFFLILQGFERDHFCKMHPAVARLVSGLAMITQILNNVIKMYKKD